MIERHSFEDANLIAIFSLQSDKFKITFKRGPTGRVFGEIEGEGEDLRQTLQGVAANKPIGSLDFIKALKMVKGSIFSLKGSSGGLR